LERAKITLIVYFFHECNIHWFPSSPSCLSALPIPVSRVEAECLSAIEKHLFTLSPDAKVELEPCSKPLLHLISNAKKMNTLSVATAVSGLTGICLKTAVSLDALRPKFQSADVTITALCSECTVISASLTDIQMFVLQSDFGSRSELHTTFDTVLTACMVGFACLEVRIKKLETTKPADHTSNSRTPWRVRAKSEWDEDAMRKYLSHLRDGKAALLILVQLISKLAVCSLLLSRANVF
jgi:hypothetical protein